MSVFNINNPQSMPEILHNSSICFGVFDGVHKGHQFEIESCIKDAKSQNNSSVCVTFDIDPDELFIKDFKKLMSNENRLETLKNSGIEHLIVIDFHRIKDLFANDFLDLYFGSYTPKSLHVGQGFKFGKNASGDTDLLKNWGERHNMKVHVHELIKQDGEVISSTRLRKQLYE